VYVACRLAPARAKPLVQLRLLKLERNQPDEQDNPAIAQSVLLIPVQYRCVRKLLISWLK
jgi:hypothetical protein